MGFSLKNLERYVYLAVIVAGVVWWYFQPSPGVEIREVPVEVPVQVTVPQIIKVFDTVHMPPVIKVKDNKELVEAYQKLQTENEKLKAYKESVKIRSYDKKYSDDTQDISVFTEVEGKVLKQSVEYDIKPREINTVVTETVPVIIEPKRSLRFGAEMGVPVNQGSMSPVFKGNVILENKKGLMLSAGYDTEQRVWGGVIVKIF